MSLADPPVSDEYGLRRQTAEAMADFLRRAQRFPLVDFRKALPELHEAYEKGGRRETLLMFVRIAQEFYQDANSQRGWRAARDARRLLRSIAQLELRLAEYQRYEALRRLRSPTGPIRFFQPPKSKPIKIMPMGEFPRFDTITLASLSPGCGSGGASPR
jgi:hypothetical protein